MSNLERDRAIHDELVGAICTEQKDRGQLPTPEEAAKFIASERILERADANEERARHAIPLAKPKAPPPPEPEFRRSNLLDQDVRTRAEAADSRQLLTRGQVRQRLLSPAAQKQKSIQNWYRLMAQYDPHFRAEAMAICDQHGKPDEHAGIVLNERGQELMRKLVAATIDKYGDPLHPEYSRRIQVG